MYKFVITLFIAVAATSVNGQILSLGRCSRTLRPQADFNVTAYTGVWNEIKKYPFAFEPGQCITAEYTLSDDGTYVHVLNSQVLLAVPSSIRGRADVVSTDGSAELEVTFRFGLISQSSPYWVLLTDYEDFALVYSCTDLGLVKTEFAWILSRTKQLSLTAMAAIDNYNKEKNVINTKELVDTNQSPLACWTFN